ncbi:MFS transporter [Inquilinus sp. NPDC058860]|uniref:MFS transporter n=1 Tax=Inquilinus sp. NPDC058860 TaxID=3346652 RepID=UPI003676CA88
MTDAEVGLQPRRRVAGRAVVVATATIFGLTYGLAAPLIALQLTERGYEETVIGLNAALHAVGVLAVAPALPRLARRWGARRLVLFALAGAAAALALFPLAPAIWLWFPLRFCLGVASEILFVMSETWLNQLSDERSRARTMAVYTASLSLGFALGPVILATLGSDGAPPFLAGSAIAVLALLVMAAFRVDAPGFEEPSTGRLTRYLRLAPIAIGSTALNAAVETAGLSFVALYAIGLGWGEGAATLLVTTLMIGAILLQLPIGWLGDRMDRQRLVLILSLLSGGGALVWPFVIGTPWLAYPLIFLWGGVFVGIYTIMLTVVGSRFQGSDLVAIYALMSLAWGLGALLGPALAGLAMEAVPHGLPIFVALICLAFAGYVKAARSRA